MSDRSMTIRAGMLLVAVVPVLAGCSLLFSAPPIDGGPVPSPVVVGASPVALPTASAAETPTIATTQGPLPSSSELATLLGPEDFAAVGVEGAGPASFNDAGPGAVYAVYAGQSSSSGGIELDVFVLTTLEEAVSYVHDPGFSALDDATKLSIGAEHATLDQGSPTNDGSSTYDSIWAQRGRLVFVLGIPSSPASRDQLLALAKLVLERSQQYQ